MYKRRELELSSIVFVKALLAIRGSFVDPPAARRRFADGQAQPGH